MSERQLHLAVADLIRTLRVPKLIAFHPAQEGVHFVIIPPGGKAHFLELIYGKGRLSPAQEEFKAAAIVCPCPHSVVRTIEEAATVLHLWGAIKENPFAKQQARAAA